MFIDRIRETTENAIIEKIDKEVLDSIKECAKKGWTGLMLYRYKNQQLFELYHKNLEHLNNLGFYTSIEKGTYNRTFIRVKWISSKTNK